MDILKLLTHKEKIGGLSVFDSRIEMLLLDFKEKDSALSIGAFASVNLSPGIIIGGEIKDEEGFIAAINKLFSDIDWQKGAKKTKISSFIISLPANFVYNRIFSFPAALSDVQIDEAMKLNFKFSLPLPEGEIYADWENIEYDSGAKKEIILCASSRNTVDKYLKVFTKTDITPVALEFHSLSILRVADLPIDEAALIVIFSNNNLEFAVVEDKTIRFMQSFNLEQVSKIETGKTDNDIILDRMQRIINFYDAEKGKRGFLRKIYLAGDRDRMEIYKDLISDNFNGIRAETLQILPIFPQILPAQNSNLAHITFGAALRGLMPRNEDTIISLLPVGTEEIYERKRIVSFVHFASDLISALSVFFVVLFLGSWILMTILLSNIENSLSRQVSLPEGLLELKAKAIDFNDSVGQIDKLDRQIPKWSRLMERIGALGASGVTLTRIDISSFKEVNLSGIATTRDNLLQFRNILENSGLFTEVKIPLNYLEQKDNISFLLNLEFKNIDFIF